jgi:Tol biopolymer transport system component
MLLTALARAADDAAMRVQRCARLALAALVLAVQPAVAEAARYELHVLDVVSGADRTVVRSEVHEYTPLRFESGDALTLLRSGGGHDEVQRLMLADGRRTALTPQHLPGGSPPFPAVAPDGRLAAFAPVGRRPRATYRVWIGRPSGKVIAWLRPTYRFDGTVAWSSDGRQLVVLGPRRPTLWTVDVFSRTGRFVRSVALRNTRYLQSPALSPDGTRLLVNRWSTVRGGPSEASVVDLSSGQVTRLQPEREAYHDGSGGFPLSGATWSPTGAMILALRDPGLQLELFEASSLGRIQTLVPPHQVWGSASWSPDGMRALVLELGDYGNGLLMLDLTSGAPVLRELVPLGRRDIVATAWAPDSQTVAYDSSR